MQDDRTTKAENEAAIRRDLAQWRIERDALIGQLDALVTLLQSEMLARQEPAGRA